MKNKILLLLISVSFSGALLAEGGFKYRKLKPADPPCLFLLDENTGQPTGNPMNTPCTLGSVTVKPGQKVNPAFRKKYGKGNDIRIRKKPGRKSQARGIEKADIRRAMKSKKGYDHYTSKSDKGNQ